MMLVLSILIGIIAGSLVNMYIYGAEKTRPFYKWYVGFFYKHVKYIGIEIILALICFFIYRTFGMSITFTSYTLMTSILVAAGVQDIKTREIPNHLVIFGMIAALAISALNLDTYHIVNALIGFIIAGGAFGLLYLVTKGGVGAGDVKLFACIGLFLGYSNIVSAMVLATMSSAIMGIILLMMRTKDRKGTLPFAPFIFVGSLLSILWV